MCTHEIRQFGRREASGNAWLVTPGRPRLPCKIAKLWTDGALLELLPPPWLPFNVDVHLPGTPGAQPCEVLRVTAHGISVRFRPERPITRRDTAVNTDLDEQQRWVGSTSGSSTRINPRALLGPKRP